MPHINVLLRDIKVEPLLEGPWAGVDAGVMGLHNNNFDVKYLYGDFDSVSELELEKLQENLDFEISPAEKDFTDSEIALKALSKAGYTSIDVYGALGGRIDHELINIQLLKNTQLREINIRLIDDKNIISLLPSGRHILSKTSLTYVSFVPFYDETCLTLSGFKYDLTDKYISIGETLTVSNEFQNDEACVETSHDLLMINSSD
ncbi:thiamine diphosphokinase [Jeotgalicoccus huakuii]|nr:thiamine diphosphokinase [Jeotgalicoccus huakuii]